MSRTGRAFTIAALLLTVTPAAALAGHRKNVDPVALRVKNAPPAVKQVWHDCASHNSLHGHYPAAILEQALADLPTDDKEYTLCANEILNAESREVGGSHSLPAVSAANRRRIAKNAANALRKATHDGGEPIDLSGQKIAAGVVTVDGSSLLSNLPAPILAVLAMLLALAAVPVALRIQRFVRARRSR